MQMEHGFIKTPDAGARHQRTEFARQQLESYIEQTAGDDGTKLPPERQLARHLGISRRALRAQLTRLEASGQIWRHRGKGTFLGTRPLELINDMPALRLGSNPEEILETRLQLEPSLGALAAVRATPAEVNQIRWYLQKSAAATHVDTFERWDGALHRAIATASHNSLLLALFETVNAVRRRTYWGQLQETAVSLLGLSAILAAHERIVDAISSRDPVAAREEMYTHIESVRGAMFECAREGAKRPIAPDYRTDTNTDPRQQAR